MAETRTAGRIQIVLTQAELQAVDDWRNERRMPNRASAVRELLKRGLAAEGFGSTKDRAKSGDLNGPESLLKKEGGAPS